MGLGHLLCARPHTRPSTFIISFTPLSRPRDFPGGSNGKESACNAGDLGSISGSGRSSGDGNDYPFQYSSLENSMNRGALWATVHGLAKSRA